MVSGCFKAQWTRKGQTFFVDLVICCTLENWFSPYRCYFPVTTKRSVSMSFTSTFNEKYKQSSMDFKKRVRARQYRNRTSDLEFFPYLKREFLWQILNLGPGNLHLNRYIVLWRLNMRHWVLCCHLMCLWM